ncbi:hypothetical protein DID88_005246 [Monilinia fructigena]|uniref:Uncharacterized protein n=1 Tax=Monilinia fructigena TaxID=38457 RepID=A0A395J0F5_9HELO|nr:hypothetical protein DID88_005246 [Monilinia fructigena]
MTDIVMKDAPVGQAQQAGGDTADPVIGPAPKGTSGLARGAVRRTKFSEAYRSIFTLNLPNLIPLLRHVNCNYLSTKGHAPTVLELKQHAQALVILLKQITISTQPGAIDSTNQNAVQILGRELLVL